MPLYSLMLLLLFHTDGACPCAAWYRTHRAGCAGGADNFPASTASAQAQAECEQAMQIYEADQKLKLAKFAAKQAAQAEAKEKPKAADPAADKKQSQWLRKVPLISYGPLTKRGPTDMGSHPSIRQICTS